jgi:hypothetical protein
MLSPDVCEKLLFRLKQCSAYNIVINKIYIYK